VCVCARVCVRDHLHVCVHVHVCICLRVYAGTCMCFGHPCLSSSSNSLQEHRYTFRHHTSPPLCLHACTHTHTHTHTHIHTLTHTHNTQQTQHTNTHTTHTNTHTHTRTHIHTHTQTHTQASPLATEVSVSLNVHGTLVVRGVRWLGSTARLVSFTVERVQVRECVRECVREKRLVRTINFSRCRLRWLLSDALLILLRQPMYKTAYIIYTAAYHICKTTYLM